MPLQAMRRTGTPPPRAKKPVEAAKSVFNPLENAEHVALLVVQEAKASMPNALHVVLKLVILSALGGVLASNSQQLSCILVPTGVILIAIALGWLDAIREECSGHRFFPDEKLNSLGAAIFKWQWLAAFACTIFAVSSLAATHNTYGHLWSLAKYAAVPLSLMLVGRSVEPYRFNTARSDIQKAEHVLRQLVSAETASDVSAMAPIVELDKIPVYKLCSVAALLRTWARRFDTHHKLAVELEYYSSPTVHPTATRSIFLQVFSIIYSPFRKIASQLFLAEACDIVLYAVIALYLALVYFGSFYVPFTPLALLVPFMGPKSRTGRYLRQMQKDIRETQGRNFEKKGGLTPEDVPWEGWPPLNWPMIIYITTIHTAALYALAVFVFFGGSCPFFGKGITVKWQTAAWSFICYVISALGITAGVHRLWAHKTYKAGLPLRMLLMLFNSMANQGTIFHWARDHRVHHLYSDTVADPHDANRGFWFSHIGWLLFKKHPAVAAAGKRLNLNDLYADPVVMFQKKAGQLWNIMWGLVLPAFPALAWGDSVWNGFLLAGALRYVVLLHATWAVNSVVHAHGTKPYNSSHATTENGWVSLFTLGEGWHNWHHAFSYDYAASELGALQQFNPTKVFIDLMALLGLAWDRKRATSVWDGRKTRWEEQSGRPVLESIEGPPMFRRRVITLGPVDYDEDEIMNMSAKKK
eukprot:gnl/TRDRNA2_/TRDRNA2_174154_c4_seq8.p1 gnl/TRDRNA2_/TRDRNA2_174154_c4~~gnl/TRDRNA2_/TRDRNA2_174154_c4_seq8.p1  ORF type:complete len:722 (-),score=99.44 gnl/TRDRNA2_/TRDRNA2_174154_c4_seq8:406-2493(-)